MNFFELLSKIDQPVGPFYHGTSNILDIGYLLLPPKDTNVIQEVGRNINLDQVFFTKDFGSAKIYAGRACNRFGGTPIIYQVYPVGPITVLQEKPGSTVYYSKWAYIVREGY